MTNPSPRRSMAAVPTSTPPTWMDAQESRAELVQSIEKLQHTHLPSVSQAMEALYERLTYGLVTDADGVGVEDALQHAEDELVLLAQFLRETGLAGMPLSKEQDVQQVTQTLFEQRARLSDATAMVSSMLEKKQAA